MNIQEMKKLVHLYSLKQVKNVLLWDGGYLWKLIKIEINEEKEIVTFATIPSNASKEEMEHLIDSETYHRIANLLFGPTTQVVFANIETALKEMHPVEIYQMYVELENEVSGKYGSFGEAAEVLTSIHVEFEQEELGAYRNSQEDDAPFHFMKLRLFVQDDSEDGATLIDDEIEDGATLIDDDEIEENIEALLKEPKEKFTFEIFYWPEEEYQELLADCKENDDWYMDEGTGDWSMEIDLSPTIYRLLEALEAATH